MVINEKEEGSTKRSIKFRRLKLVRYCIQLTIAKNEFFSKTPETFLQGNCLDLLRCAFLRKLSGCVRNITVFCQLLLRPIISAVLADTDISVKPKHRPIYRSISIRNTSVYPQIALKKQPAMSRTRHKLSNCVENEIEFFDLKAFQTHVHIGISRT